MTETVADLIEQKLCGNPGPLTSGKTLFEQTGDLLKQDRDGLKALGRLIRIPEAAELPAHLHVEFNPLLAELLLRDGSVLLDRCLRERAELEDLAAKWFEVTVQVDELCRLSRITKAEELTYPELIKITESEIAAASSEKTAYKDASNQLSVALSETNKNYKTIEKQLALSLHGFGNDPSFDTLAIHNLEVENRGLSSQKLVQDGQSEAAANRESALSQTRSFKEAQLKFQRERNEVARLVALRRAEAVLLKDGPLNYGGRIMPLWDRLRWDFIGAYLRLARAKEGLNKLYGYPTDSFPKIQEQAINFDELITWCQVTNTWLASFLDNQQQVTRSLSLFQLIGPDKFDQGKQNPNLATWPFALTPTHFYDKRMVRLRSLALQIFSQHDWGSWNVSVGPPPKGIMVDYNGEKQQQIQPLVGTLYLGRVNETTYTVLPEASAPSKLYNATPICDPDLPTEDGHWKVAINGLSSSGASVEDITDVILHITVALF